ncbi:hypothetical protein ASD50_10655 [Mesorhizobium sp. Root552]|nr:hypothetical protein ASD50_10655 [Mesorhizobium sp. Root552]
MLKPLAANVALGFLTLPAMADMLLGSYVARISQDDHFASDGYPLDSAAQMVRQDRANWHRFGQVDREDENDRWFKTNQQRSRLQRMLEQRGAMDAATRRAITNGRPLIQVDVYSSSVQVIILER